LHFSDGSKDVRGWLFFYNDITSGVNASAECVAYTDGEEEEEEEEVDPIVREMLDRPSSRADFDFYGDTYDLTPKQVAQYQKLRAQRREQYFNFFKERLTD
jgi:hypothetical protein